MNNATSFTYSSASEMFRSVLGDSSIKTIKSQKLKKQDSAIKEFVCNFSKVCVASAGGVIMFK